ncbi:uncharacterized protein SOCE26_075890 [Sorangium cellulosum]|uniref:Uncharacterized protein n=1 Tax=Sorangium cellulosum TaxID=56 RepID=A0A2L0F3D1_SORCE|nr:uncharacterized protein SOCE26_075890 [Sorangium cellulosum]
MATNLPFSWNLPAKPVDDLPVGHTGVLASAARGRIRCCIRRRWCCQELKAFRGVQVLLAVSYNAGNGRNPGFVVVVRLPRRFRAQGARCSTERAREGEQHGGGEMMCSHVRRPSEPRATTERSPRERARRGSPPAQYVRNGLFDESGLAYGQPPGFATPCDLRVPRLQGTGLHERALRYTRGIEPSMVSDTAPTRPTRRSPYLSRMRPADSSPGSIPGASTQKTRREPCLFFCVCPACDLINFGDAGFGAGPV